MGTNRIVRLLLGLLLPTPFTRAVIYPVTATIIIRYNLSI